MIVVKSQMESLIPVSYTHLNRARLLAPEVFPTGIDVLHLQTGRLDNEGVEALNQKFWDKFEKADFSNTTFGLSYICLLYTSCSTDVMDTNF